jgi:hypothetical protein
VSFDIPTVQLIAYSALTCASVIVATVSVVLAYRQNFGWPPIVLVRMFVINYSEQPYEFTMEFEVWNRRKYPIVIQGQDLRFRNVRFIRVEERRPLDYANTWDGGPETFSNYKSVVLEPNGHEKFEFIYVAQNKNRKKQASKVKIRVFYFDPIKNKQLETKLTKKISA